MPDLDADAILENAAKPQSAGVAGRTAAQVPIGDQIKAVQFAAATEAVSGPNADGGAKSGFRGLRPARAVSQGAV